MSKKVGFMLKYGLVGLLAFSILGAGLVWQYQRRQAGVTVYDAQVAGTMVNVRAAANGNIAEMLVKDGEKVSAGTIMAKVAVSVTEEEIQQLEQNLALAEQNFQEVQRGRTVTTPIVVENSDPDAQTRLAVAEARLQRMNELLEMGAISVKKRDEVAAEYEAAAAAASMAAPSITYQTSVVPSSPEAIKSAELQVRQAQNALKNAQSDAHATEIAAPVAGTAFWKEIQVGQAIKAGDIVASVGDASSLWLEVKVKPEDLSKIQLGQLTEGEIGEHTFNGTVTEISSLVPEPVVNTEGKSEMPESETNKLSVIKISFPAELCAQVRPGQKAKVKLVISSED